MARTPLFRGRKKITMPKRELYITRLDHTKAHGWWVRVYKEGRLVARSKLFSDKVYGGKQLAKNAAIEHRDRLMAEHGITPTRYRTVDQRSKSGMVGVMLSKRKSDGGLSVAWVASWVEGGKQRKASFSIREHGYQEAHRLAVEQRCRKTGQPIPETIQAMLPPEWLRAWLDENGILG